METAGGNELERLGVVVVGEGIDETVARILALGEAGEQSAARAGRAASQGATTFAQQFVEGSNRAAVATEAASARMQATFVSNTAAAQRSAQEQAAAVERAQQQTGAAAARSAAIQAREAAQAYVTTLQREFATEQARIKEGVARGFITTKEAQQAGREAALAYNQGVIGAIDRGAAAGAFTSRNGQAAFTEIAGSLKTVSDQATRTGASLNTIRASMTSLLASSLQTAPGVAQLGGAIGALSLGALSTIGVMAGIAAVTYGWQKWTEEARRAREEQEKLTASLRDWYEAQRNGEAGARQLQVRATQSLITQQESSIRGLEGQLESPFTQRDIAETERIRRRIAELQGLIREERAQIAAGNSDIARTISEGDVQRRNAEASSLASLITGHRATEQERARALRVLQEQQALFVAYSRPPEGTTDAVRQFFLEQRAQIAQSARSLEEALNPKPERVAAPARSTEAPERQAVVDALTRQLEALRRLNTESALADQRARDQIILLGTEGVARELLTNRLKAEEQATQARGQYSGVALSERLRAIEDERQLNDERAKAKAILTDQAAAQRFVTEAVRDANDVAERNAKTTHDGLQDGLKLYQQSQREAENLSNTLEHTLLQSVVRLATSGGVSFQSFVGVVEQGAVRMTEAIARSVANQTAIRDEAIRTNVQHQKDADIQIINEQIAHFKQLQQIAGGLGAAATGASFGYNLGRSTGDRGIGALGGAVGGALAGNELLPGWGAVIGGFTGVIGGLFGASEAQKEAAEQFRQAIRAWENSTQKFLLAAGGSTVGAQIIDTRAQAEALRNTSMALGEIQRLINRLNGDPNAPNKFQDRAAAIDAALEQMLDRIESEFFAGITQQFNELRGPAGELENQLAAIAEALRQNEANVHALAAELHYSAEQEAAAVAQVRALAEAQEAAARRAYEREQRQALESERFQTERLTATSQAQRDVIERQALIAQHEDQIAVLREQHASDQLIAATEARQAAEEAALAWQQTVAAIEQAQSDIQRDVNLGFTSPTQAFEQEKANFGFGGLSIDQIKAQYTPYAGTELTDQQRQTNKYIEQLLNDFNRWFPQAAGNATAANTVNNTAVARTVGTNEAVSYAARNLSEITGNRMADYLATIATLVRQIRDAVASRQGFGAQTASFTATPITPPGGIPSFAQPLGYAPAASGQPPMFDAASLTARSARPTSGGASAAQQVVVRNEFTFVIHQQPGEDADELSERIYRDFKERLARDAADDLLRRGNPIISGA